jgi:hypothetical protein
MVFNSINAVEIKKSNLYFFTQKQIDKRLQILDFTKNARV